VLLADCQLSMLLAAVKSPVSPRIKTFHTPIATCAQSPTLVGLEIELRNRQQMVQRMVFDLDKKLIILHISL